MDLKQNSVGFQWFLEVIPSLTFRIFCCQLRCPLFSVSLEGGIVWLMLENDLHKYSFPNVFRGIYAWKRFHELGCGMQIKFRDNRENSYLLDNTDGHDCLL